MWGKLASQSKSLFSVVNDPNISVDELNKNLELISECTYKWKMCFDTEKNKQVQKVVFSWKQSKPKHPPLLFNKAPVTYSSSQKHFEIILDENLNLTNHIKVKIQKAGIGINVIKSLNNLLLIYLIIIYLFTIYKSFVRPHLDYGDVIYDHLWLSLRACSIVVSDLHLETKGSRFEFGC